MKALIKKNASERERERETEREIERERAFLHVSKMQQKQLLESVP